MNNVEYKTKIKLIPLSQLICVDGNPQFVPKEKIDKISFSLIIEGNKVFSPLRYENDFNFRGNEL